MPRSNDWDGPPEGGPFKTVLRNVLILALVCAGAAWALSYRSDVSGALEAWLPRSTPVALDEAARDESSEAANYDEAAAVDWGAEGTASDEAPYGEATADEPYAEADYDRELMVRRASNGHFFVNAMVNGISVNFLVDTGASDVMLTPADARRLQFNESLLDYSLPYETANGIVYAAPVTLRELRIGQLEMYDVDAIVNEAASSVSLLGMSFLERLSGYSVEGDRLVLQW